MEPEEMSHIAMRLSRQDGTINQLAFFDCVHTIKREYAVSKVETEDDLMALRNRMKERKGIKA